MEKLTIKELEDYMKTPLSCLRGGKAFQLRMVNELHRYKKLEEEIGCPLEIRCKLKTDQYIFDKYGEPYQIKTFYENFFIVRYRGKEERLEEFGYYGAITDFPYSEYKKTWWLKADKSE